jgi:glucoamylase
MLLAWLPDRHDEDTEDKLVRGADFVVSYRTDGHAPSRSGWEEQSGCSPPTIASAIAGLVCLADLLRRAGPAVDG